MKSIKFGGLLIIVMVISATVLAQNSTFGNYDECRQFWGRPQMIQGTETYVTTADSGAIGYTYFVSDIEVGAHAVVTLQVTLYTEIDTTGNYGAVGYHGTTDNGYVNEGFIFRILGITTIGEYEWLSVLVLNDGRTGYVKKINYAGELSYEIIDEPCLDWGATPTREGGPTATQIVNVTSYPSNTPTMTITPSPTSTVTQTPTFTSSPTPVIYQEAFVTVPSCLLVRETPQITNNRLGCIGNGEVVEFLVGSETQHTYAGVTYTYVQINYRAQEGWVAKKYLSMPNQ